MKKILIVIGALFLTGCNPIHECKIKAANVCGSDNVKYTDTLFVCSFSCHDYSKFVK